MPTLDDLLTRGYFPKELPPPFKTVSFATKVAEKFPVLVGLAKDLPPTKLAQHNLARPGNIHRRLGIPDPAPQLMLCAFLVKHWQGFQMHFAKSKSSLSLPEDSPAGRAVENDVFKLFFDFLSKNGVSFYDSESELLKISRPIDEINAINLPVVGFVFGY